MSASTCPARTRLADVPILAGCTDDELARIESLVTIVEVADDRVLMNEGTFGHEFALLLSGSATVSSGGQVIACLGPGDFVGEVSSLLGVPRTGTVRTTAPSQLAVVAPTDFEQFLHDAPAATRALLRAVTARWYDTIHDHGRQDAPDSVACPPPGR